MNKLGTYAVSVVLLCGILSGCSMAEPITTITPSSAVTESTTGSAAGSTSETTLETSETEPERGHFEFKHKVMSSIFRDIMGDDMCEAYYSYVDAVMTGKDSFSVKSNDDYDWMLGQFPCCFFPVVDKYVESDYGSGYKKGKGTFHYVTSREEFEQKEAEFEKLVTDILNENLRDDYSDFEKVLALYLYFADNYTYDYKTLEQMETDPFVELSPYRFLTEKTGICSECAPAFSYLLLEAGVDATVAGGPDHSWSYVTINGKNYHIDPTFAMSSGDDLSFLMMTDGQRELEGDFVRGDMTIACHYKDEHNGENYVADDDYFSTLWGCKFTSWDRENKIIYYADQDGNSASLDYSSYG